MTGPVDPFRNTARLAGALYLITFVSMPTLALYGPFHDHLTSFLTGSGSQTGVLWGAASELVVALANIGTAVVLFPVLKRQNESAALGFVTTRVLEASLMFVGVVSVLALVSMREVAGSAADPSVITTGHALVGVYDGSFLVSQSLLPVLNDVLLGYVLYRSVLVPRALPIIAFIGAPLLLASDLAVFFGGYDRTNPLTGLAALPVAVFEFGTGLWLVVKGFNPSSPVLAGAPAVDPRPVVRAEETVQVLR